jgi:AcrR family transcriptional regulator
VPVTPTPTQAPTPARAPVRTRDAERTQQRILAAALHEFSAKGIAGARVDAIAARAGVNKRMLYYYFGSKEGLFQAVLAQRLAELAESPRAPRLADRFVEAATAPSTGGEFVRLHMWEALQRDRRRPLEAEALRQDSAARRTDLVRDEQARGGIGDDLAPEQVALMELALQMFPVAFPDLTRLVTGHDPGSDEFRAAQRDFFDHLAARLA